MFSSVVLLLKKTVSFVNLPFFFSPWKILGIIIFIWSVFGSHEYPAVLIIPSAVGPRRIGFYRNRISTGNQNHHSVSGSPEPDFLKIRFRSGRTGFQNLTGFRPDFIIWLDYYRISKFSRIPTGIQKFWQCLSLEGGKEWDVSWFIEVTLTHKRISIRSLGGGGKPCPIDPIKYYTEVC